MWKILPKGASSQEGEQLAQHRSGGRSGTACVIEVVGKHEKPASREQGKWAPAETGLPREYSLLERQGGLCSRSTPGCDCGAQENELVSLFERISKTASRK